MKLTDKRFWIYEGSVLMYSMVLLMLAIYFGEAQNITLGDVLLRPVEPMLFTGVITFMKKSILPKVTKVRCTLIVPNQAIATCGNGIVITAERVLYHNCGATKCSLTINNLFK